MVFMFIKFYLHGIRFMSLFEILESSFCAVVVPEFILYIAVKESGGSTELTNFYHI